MEVRSYRRVFDLERRIYRVDRLRLNPSGVPLRGIVYFLALGVATSLTARLPGAGAIVGALPWYVRDLALPGVLPVLNGDCWATSEVMLSDWPVTMACS